MNCIYEVAGTVILHLRSQFGPPRSGDYELCRAEDNLEDCRSTLWMKEQELSKLCVALGKDAVQKRKAGDIDGARMRFRERKRQLERLEKMRNSLLLVDRQLDALRSRELDREIMESLKLSSQAMKKAGIRVGVEDAEKVMNELESQIRQSADLTTVLSAPMSDDTMDADMDLAELDAELGLIAETELTPPPSSSTAGLVVAAPEETEEEEETDEDPSRSLLLLAASPAAQKTYTAAASSSSSFYHRRIPSATASAFTTIGARSSSLDEKLSHTRSSSPSQGGATTASSSSSMLLSA